MSDRRRLWALLALMALATLLRVLVVGQSSWADELYLYEIVHGNGLGRAMEIVRETESTPALYFVVAWVFAQVGGDDSVWIRIPALLFSVGTVPVIYALGVRTVGRTAGLVAAALFAITPFDIFYGTEGRAYAAVAFFCALSTLSVVMLAQTGRRRWVAVLALAVAGAAYSHYLTFFVLAAQFVFALVAFRDRWRPVLAGYGAAALLYLPWLPFALDQFESNTSERVPPVASVVQGAKDVLRIWVGHPFRDLDEVPGLAAVAVVAVGLAVAAAFALAGAVARRTTMSRTTALLVVLAAATPIGAALYELTDSSVFGPRYLSASVPAGTLVIGALLAAPRRGAIVAACTAAVVVGVAVGTMETLRPDSERPNYRAAAHELDRIAAPGEPIIELSTFVGPPSRNLSYFLERPHEYFRYGTPLADVYEQGHRSGRLHVVGLAPSFAQLLPLFGVERQGFRLVDEREWDGFARVKRQTYESVRQAARPTPRPGRP